MALPAAGVVLGAGWQGNNSSERSENKEYIFHTL